MNSAQLLPYRCVCEKCGTQTNRAAATAPVKLVLCQGCVYAAVAREIFNPGGAK